MGDLDVGCEVKALGMSDPVTVRCRAWVAGLGFFRVSEFRVGVAGQLSSKSLGSSSCYDRLRLGDVLPSVESETKRGSGFKNLCDSQCITLIASPQTMAILGCRLGRPAWNDTLNPKVPNPTLLSLGLKPKP